MTDTAPRLVRLAEVIQRTSLSRSAIYLRMKEGTFPQSYKLGQKCVRWSDGDITAWINDQIG